MSIRWQYHPDMDHFTKRFESFHRTLDQTSVQSGSLLSTGSRSGKPLHTASDQGRNHSKACKTVNIDETPDNSFSILNISVAVHRITLNSLSSYPASQTAVVFCVCSAHEIIG
ncbi:hypothetical protein TNCV_2424191 [Trichonephila clavipes]|nr:hypothetical protein TNCV_2424191 [Trichonephila clavipes]